MDSIFGIFFRLVKGLSPRVAIASTPRGLTGREGQKESFPFTACASHHRSAVAFRNWTNEISLFLVMLSARGNFFLNIYSHPQPALEMDFLCRPSRASLSLSRSLFKSKITSRRRFMLWIMLFNPFKFIARCETKKKNLFINIVRDLRGDFDMHRAFEELRASLRIISHANAKSDAPSRCHMTIRSFENHDDAPGPRAVVSVWVSAQRNSRLFRIKYLRNRIFPPVALSRLEAIVSFLRRQAKWILWFFFRSATRSLAFFSPSQILSNIYAEKKSALMSSKKKRAPSTCDQRHQSLHQQLASRCKFNFSHAKRAESMDDWILITARELIEASTVVARELWSRPKGMEGSCVTQKKSNVLLPRLINFNSRFSPRLSEPEKRYKIMQDTGEPTLNTAESTAACMLDETAKSVIALCAWLAGVHPSSAPRKSCSKQKGR